VVDSVEMCLKLSPRDGPDERHVLVQIVRHLLRIREVQSDTSKDVSCPVGMDSLGVDELDEYSTHVDHGVVYEPALLEFLVLVLHC